MNIFGISFPREYVFALVIGLVDGILTALTLAGGKVLNTRDSIETTLVLRISMAAALSGAFIFFVAEYVRLRGELVHAERHLNLTSHGHLATTQLGRMVFLDALRGTAISGVFSFVGALLPLISGAVLPGPRWLPIAVAVLALGLLGVGLARSVYGNTIRWTISLMIAGILLTIVGVKLHVI
jgi:predicted membrane protein (TIGR00267 family)